MKKIFLSKAFSPKHNENKMENEGDLIKARNSFLNKRFNNVDYLLRKRYNWMNNYISPGMKVIEIGCGTGFSKLYIKEPITLTDTIKSPWVDKIVDATKMCIDDNSVDVIIVSHAIHHFYSPAQFFKECERTLKKNGLILISDTYTSLSMRTILNIMKHEGYNYDVEVFNYQTICNDKKDPWSANCAIPELLFDDEKKFNTFFKRLTITKHKNVEFLIFLLSGGVVSKIKMIELPYLFLRTINLLDKILVCLFPKIFALGKEIVIKKN